MLKDFRNYLVHSKKERTSSVWLLILAMVAVAAPFVYALFFREKVVQKSYENEIAGISMQGVEDTNAYFSTPYQHEYKPRTYSKNASYTARRDVAEKENLSAALFYYDPNTIGKNEWVRLGLKEKTANTILNYTAKGGHFYKPADIKKIWGISPELAERIMPYAKIEPTATIYKTNDKPNSNDAGARPAYKPRPMGIVALNTTDTSALIALPGIGSKLSQRILNYRDKLGGFYAVEQVREVYGLPDSTYQKIAAYLTADAAAIKKINLNTATFNELKDHPYIRYNLAKVLLAYREQHGKYNTAADLAKVVALDESAIKKMLPYLSFE